MTVENFRKCIQKTLVSEDASNEMLELLLQQEVDYKIPESLPSNVKVANKTGETDDCENDCAIVYSNGGDYIICMMSEGGILMKRQLPVYRI